MRKKLKNKKEATEKPKTKAQKIKELSRLKKAELIEMIIENQELTLKVLSINEQLEFMLRRRLLE